MNSKQRHARIEELTRRLADLTEQLRRPCLHADVRLVWRTFRDGTRHAQRQCQDCGTSLGSVKQDTLAPEVARTMGLYDPNLKRDRQLRDAIARARDERAELISAQYQVSGEARLAEYQEHLRSPEWQTIRALVFARCGGWCEQDGCHRRATQVHHLTYDRLGWEELTDLMGLCGPCHKAISDGTLVASAVANLGTGAAA